METAAASVSPTGVTPVIAIVEEDLDQIAGGAKLDLTVKKDPKGDVTVGAGVKWDSGWAVGGSVGTDGSGSVTVTIPL